MAERPVECSHCKKAIQVTYKEIVDQSMLITEMCADCPILHQKLHGQPTPATLPEGWQEAEAGLCCGTCGTSLESVQMGTPVGCSECYTLFGDLLLNELTAMEKLPKRVQKALAQKKPQTVHMGKTPERPAIIPASSRLATLNEALNEALGRENYEQAAWIRDQINALKEKPDERQD